MVMALGLIMTAAIAIKSLCFPSGGIKISGCAAHTPFLSISGDRAKSTEHLIDAPFIDQREDYPTGCEAVSAVMALNYLGIDISAREFIDSFLDCGRAPFYVDGNVVGDSPYEYFLGSPYDNSGWGCYAPVIERALNKCVGDKNFPVTRTDGKSLRELCKEYIDRNIPVIMWATMEMQEAYTTTTWETAKGESFTWIAPEHCLLLVGYDKENYYFNDPRQGKQVGYKKSAVEKAYKSLGGQAVVIDKE